MCVLATSCLPKIGQKVFPSRATFFSSSCWSYKTQYKCKVVGLYGNKIDFVAQKWKTEYCLSHGAFIIFTTHRGN